MNSEYSQIETDFLEFSKEKLICFPVPETAEGLTRHATSCSTHNYVDFKETSKMLGLGPYGSFNLADYLSADVLERIHENQCCLESAIFNELQYGYKVDFEDIDGCIKKAAKKYGASILTFGKGLYNHPKKNDLELLSRWPMACAVDVYRNILDDPNAVDWLDTNYNMGIYVIKCLDDSGIDSYDIKHGSPQHYFYTWVDETEKFQFRDRLKKIRKDLKEKDTKVKANTGGLQVAQQPSDVVKKMDIYSVFDEETKRPNRRKGGKNPLGGKVGYGSQKPTM